ncbi:MAG: invasion associated locus B family protein [Pseudomonadota bacterium]
MRIGKTIALALVGVAAVTAEAGAQTNESVAAFRDWSVFNPDNPKECYIVAVPSSSDAQRGGASVTVSRGDILLFVTIRPADGVDKEISFTGGYPFRNGSTVEVQIGGDKFAMAPGSGDSQEWAWPPSPSADVELVNAMKAGSNAQITAISSRGTTTIDQFSLLGFTAALEEAERLCQ